MVRGGDGKGCGVGMVVLRSIVVDARIGGFGAHNITHSNDAGDGEDMMIVMMMIIRMTTTTMMVILAPKAYGAQSTLLKD